MLLLCEIDPGAILHRSEVAFFDLDKILNPSVVDLSLTPMAVSSLVSYTSFKVSDIPAPRIQRVVQELFFDYHFRNVSDRYDFDSARSERLSLTQLKVRLHSFLRG